MRPEETDERFLCMPLPYDDTPPLEEPPYSESVYVTRTSLSCPRRVSLSNPWPCLYASVPPPPDPLELERARKRRRNEFMRTGRPLKEMEEEEAKPPPPPVFSGKPLPTESLIQSYTELGDKCPLPIALTTHERYGGNCIRACNVWIGVFKGF